MTLENEKELRKELLGAGYKEYGPYGLDDLDEKIPYVLYTRSAEEIRMIREDTLSMNPCDKAKYRVFTKGLSYFPEGRVPYYGDH